MARYRCDTCGSTFEVPGQTAETIEDRCTYTKGDSVTVLRRVDEPRKAEGST